MTTTMKDRSWLGLTMPSDKNNNICIHKLNWLSLIIMFSIFNFSFRLVNWHRKIKCLYIYIYLKIVNTCYYHDEKNLFSNHALETVERRILLLIRSPLLLLRRPYSDKHKYYYMQLFSCTKVYISSFNYTLNSSKRFHLIIPCKDVWNNV